MEPFTLVYHNLQLKLNLSAHEYFVLNSIVKLSEKLQYNGWCKTSKQKLAARFGLSRRTINYIIDELLKKKYIIKHENGWLKPQENIAIEFDEFRDINKDENN